LSKKDGFVVRAQSSGRDLVHCLDGLSGCSVLLALKFWRERGRVLVVERKGIFVFGGVGESGRELGFWSCCNQRDGVEGRAAGRSRAWDGSSACVARR
jgi:hypothetical protein